MAASRRGSMDPALSKVIYLHIPARHPPSFPELELSTVVQSAALLSVGLLYQGSGHRLTTEILLGEMGRKPGGDNAGEREGYALAAGFALGLVTLGKGAEAWGIADLHVEDRLWLYLSGGADPDQKNPPLDASGNPTLPFLRSQEDSSEGGGQIMEGSLVNLDVTSPAAAVALGLMYMKTNNERVAARVAMPDTHYALEYVRPDFILLRLVARSLILWDSVQPTQEWIQAQIPDIVKRALQRSKRSALDVDDDDDDDAHDERVVDVDHEALAQTYVNILAGACLSIGLRFAGTADARAQELLHRYVLWFIKRRRYAPALGASTARNHKHMRVDRSTLEMCIDVAVLSLSCVMAGTGHLPTFRLLRYLRRRRDPDADKDMFGGLTFGNHLAISMAIGFLFLAGGASTFGTSNTAVAALLIALYPRFPTGPNDHRCHLQAFRHMYVLAIEPRCVDTVDIDTRMPVYVPLEITVRETPTHAESTYNRIAPCILPEQGVLKRVRVCGPRYWPRTLEMPHDAQGAATLGPLAGGALYVKRKVGSRAYADDPLGCRSLLSRAFRLDNDSLEHTTTAIASLSSSLTGSAPSSSSSHTDELLSAFSADPSLLAFAHQLCTPPATLSPPPVHAIEFARFCTRALHECVAEDRPGVLAAHVGLYSAAQTLVDVAVGRVRTGGGGAAGRASLAAWSLKLAGAYVEAHDTYKWCAVCEPLVQASFVAALAKRVDDIFDPLWGPGRGESARRGGGDKGEQQAMLSSYITSLDYPLSDASSSAGEEVGGDPPEGHVAELFGAFLTWADIPRPSEVAKAKHNLAPLLLGLGGGGWDKSTLAFPFLALLLPETPARTLTHLSQCLCL